MEYKHSNFEEHNRAVQQHLWFGAEDDIDSEYKERFWATLDRFPSNYSKDRIQKIFYSQKEVKAGHVLLTLRQMAECHGRPLRRFVSVDKSKLDSYLDNDYYFLPIDIDEWSEYHQNDKKLVVYEDMIKMVEKFRSPEFPEVYVKPSHSTDKKPWKFHLYVRTRDPFYYRLVAGGGAKRIERPNSLAIPECKMVDKFLRAFMDFFPEYFRTHQFSKVDKALFGIHQCLHGAPATDISKATRDVLPGTVLGIVPRKDPKNDPFSGVPSQYLDGLSYPCNATMRFKAWGLTLLPCSFDVKLPSQWISDKVGDGSRRAFATQLARDLWVAVHFNLCHYPEHAEPYNRRKLYNMVMREFYVGADLEDVNMPRIESTVDYVLNEMDADVRPIDEIIEAFYAKKVIYDENGKIVRDYYKIWSKNRTSHKHVDRMMEELKAEGVIKGGRFTKRGAELKAILASKCVSEQALKNHGVKPWKERRKRSDKGKKRKGRSVWADYVYLCRRDVDGRIIVTKDVGELPRFRKYCSRVPIGYVSSPLPSDDPLNIDHVINVPQNTPCEDPWGIPEDG